jgi:hypothetical protein
MAAWKGILTSSYLLLLTLSTAAAQDLTSCGTPKEEPALAVVKLINSACVLSKEALPDGDILPDFVVAIDESIKSIGGRLDKPSPFGKCWWDSRFDCYKVKGALIDLSAQVALVEDAHYRDPDLGKTYLPRRAKALEHQEQLIVEMDSFCNGLRH